MSCRAIHNSEHYADHEVMVSLANKKTLMLLFAGIALVLAVALLIPRTAFAQEGDRPILNESVLSPKQKYPLHVQVTRSNVRFVQGTEFSSTTFCYPLFGLSVCSTSGSATPTQTGFLTMRVKIEETGEEADVECFGRMYCQALPPGLYAARFYSVYGRRLALIVPALPLEGKNKDKEVAAYFAKDEHRPHIAMPTFDPIRK